jgi:hypothetical protein
MRVYLTFCSAQKDNSLQHSAAQIPPDVLYTSRRIQSFMQTCNARKVRWAILSDQYGVWFSEEKHVWYEKHPHSVTDQEFAALVADFDRKLADFDEICFCPGTGEKRIHSLYKRLLNASKLKERIVQKYYHEIC